MSEDSEEIFKTLFERLYNLPPDRQFRSRGKRNLGNKKSFYLDIVDMNVNQMIHFLCYKKVWPMLI